MYIRFLLLIHVICYDFFGSMCCKGVRDRASLTSAQLNTPPHQLHNSRAGLNATEWRECAHPSAEGRRRCPDHLKRDRARKLRKKAPLHPKQNYLKLHLLTTDQLKLQPGVFALERRLILLSTSRRKNEKRPQRRHLVSQNRGCKGQRRN